jgi:hypothetical protein
MYVVHSETCKFFGPTREAKTGGEIWGAGKASIIVGRACAFLMIALRQRRASRADRDSGAARQSGRGLPALASVEDYRELSAECLRIAHENQTANNRTLLLRMAELWSNLAERADGDSLDLSLRQKTAGVRALPTAPRPAR